MKTPATKFISLQFVLLFGLIGLRCDSFSFHQNDSNLVGTSNSDHLVVEVEELPKLNTEDENSSDLFIDFPNIFDVFRSLF